MKRLFSSLLLLFGAIGLFAQPKVNVSEEPVAMSMGTEMAYGITLADADLGDAEKVLKKYLKEFKGKWSGSAKSEIMLDDATIRAMSDNTVDVYIKMYEASKDVRFLAAFDLGGAFVSAENFPDEAEVAMGLVKDFAMDYYKERTEQELDAAEDMLKDLEKELDGLIKDKDKMKKDIGSSERDIDRARQDISENEADQDRKRAEIETQKDVIIKIADAVGDEKKEAEKTLKGLEKDLAKLEKDHEKLHESIHDAEASIEENKRSIKKNEKEQEAKKEEIDAQRDVVREVEGRLSAFPKR
jgi:peptidoglycan hydrolase CwlO-like protein